MHSPSNYTKILRIATFLLALGPVLAQAQDPTKIGSTLNHCSSPTVVGTTQCTDPAVKPKPVEQPKPVSKRVKAAAEQPEPSSDPVIGGVKESEVNDFLANYGKPSREAVRAILNPSDENISAMLRVEKSQLAVTAYTAQRRTELLQLAPTQRNELSQSDLPSLIGMRITVLVGTDCKGCAKVLPQVNQLVAEFPSVDARIGVVGMNDPKEFVVKTADLGVYLPVAKVSAERLKQLRVESLPAILVGDTRYPAEPAVVGDIDSALDLERAVVQVRKTNERRYNRNGKSSAKGTGNE